MAKLNKGIMAFNQETRKKGKIIAVLSNSDYKVEVIIKQDKVTRARTTVLEDWKESVTVKYRKPNKRKEKRNYEPGNEFYNDVYAFHKAFGHPTSEKPTELPLDEYLNRSGYVIEELLEGLYGTVGGNIEEFEKVAEQLMMKFLNNKIKIVTQKKPVDDVLVAQADSLIDATYFINGMLVVAGIKPHNLFKIVQNANMGKLFPDGKPRYREGDGKIIKPDNWERDFAPEGRLKAELDRQIKG